MIEARGRTVRPPLLFGVAHRTQVMKPGRLSTICLSAMLLLALADIGPATSGSRGNDNRRSADSYRTEPRLRIRQDHHRGRSFAERRSRLRNPSYIRREDRRRALTERNAERRSLHSDISAVPGSLPCRTMTSVDTVDGRRALISQRECIDASGITHVSPGTRRVVRFYDE